MSDYDVIVIGAGPNGLTAAAYLAAAGQRVLAVEKYLETGGGLVTQELCGFKLNHHAIYMMMAELLPPYRELNLADKGVAFVRPPNQVSFLFDDHKSITLYSDPERSAASIDALSPGDGARFRKMYDDFKQMCDACLLPATYFPPIPPLDQTKLLSEADDLGRLIAEISDMAPREVIDRYAFVDPRVRGAMLYLACMFGVGPEEGGLGFLVPIYVYRLMQNALVRGGSHQLSSGLRRTLEEFGGEVATSKAVTQLLSRDGRVSGVKLDDGREFTAKAVISTLNPQQTFLQLLPPDLLDDDIREVVEAWEWEHNSLFITNAGIVGEAPRYEGYDPAVNDSLIVVMGYERDQDVVDHYEEVSRGELGRMAGHVTVPSLFDPLMAPNHVPLGPAHVLRWECWAPYDSDWSVTGRDAFRDRCWEFWTRYAPNLSRANKRVWVAWSPADIANHLATMVRGSIKHGAYLSLQMGYNRPFPEASSYRTFVDGLYVGGASTHPGGMVIMGPGYNVSRTVAADLGVDLPWGELAMVKAARDRGYLAVQEDD